MAGWRSFFGSLLGSVGAPATPAVSGVHFKRPGVPLFKSTGIPAHNNLCCCHEEPAVPCFNCSASQTPNGMEVTFTADDLTDHTCVDCSGKLRTGEPYILEKVEDADCYYTYCEDDPCNDISPTSGDPCFIKIMVFLSGSFVQVIVFFCVTNTDCGSLFDGLRNCSWVVDTGETAPYDCLDVIDHDLAPEANNPDNTPGDGYRFCHAGAGSVHVRALN